VIGWAKEKSLLSLTDQFKRKKVVGSHDLKLKFDIHMSVHRNITPNYNQQNATFLDLFM